MFTPRKHRFAVLLGAIALVLTAGCVKLQTADTPMAGESSATVNASGNHRFVRIIDTSDPTLHPDSSWVDAVVLKRPQLPGTDGEPPVYVKSVTSFTPGLRAEVVKGFEDLQPDVGSDVQAILGAPDAFPAWPVVASCMVKDGFVRLGNGGDIVVELAEPMETGDVIEVLEVGSCQSDWDGKEAPTAALEVYVGATAEGPWQYAGRGESPSIAVDVPVLE